MDAEILALIEKKEDEIKAADAARKAEQDKQLAEKTALIVQAFEKFRAVLPPAVEKFANLNLDESSTYAFKAEFSIPGLAPIEYHGFEYRVAGVEDGGTYDGEFYPPSYVTDRQTYTSLDFALVLAKRRADLLARLTNEWQDKRAKLEARAEKRAAQAADKPAPKSQPDQTFGLGLARAAIDAQAESWEETQARALVSIAYSLALIAKDKEVK